MKTNTTPHANNAVASQKSLSVKTNLRAGLKGSVGSRAPIGGSVSSGPFTADGSEYQSMNHG